MPRTIVGLAAPVYHTWRPPFDPLLDASEESIYLRLGQVAGVILGRYCNPFSNDDCRSERPVDHGRNPPGLTNAKNHAASRGAASLCPPRGSLGIVANDECRLIGGRRSVPVVMTIIRG